MQIVPPPVHQLIRKIVSQIRLRPRDAQVLLTLDETGGTTTATIAPIHFLGNRFYAKDCLGKLSKHGLVRLHGRTWVLGPVGLQVVSLIKESEESLSLGGLRT